MRVNTWTCDEYRSEFIIYWDFLTFSLFLGPVTVLYYNNIEESQYMYYMFLRQNLAGYKVRVLFYAFVNNVSGSVYMIEVRREGV